jgi:hypothetical protein
LRTHCGEAQAGPAGPGAGLDQAGERLGVEEGHVGEVDLDGAYRLIVDRFAEGVAQIVPRADVEGSTQPEVRSAVRT